MPTIKILTVTDLHRVRVLYAQLANAVASHRPDIVVLVGDFLDAGGDHPDQFTTAECAGFLSRLPCQEVVFVRGNHEGDNWWEFIVTWKGTGRPLRALDRAVFVHGPLVLVGFPCLMGDETAFVESLYDPDSKTPHHDGDPLRWLPKALAPHGAAARTLWLMHEPPSGTPLSRPGSVVAGNPEWVTAIDRYSPWLTISGHDHGTPRRTGRWHHKLGRSVCVNAGQTDSGLLHYCVIQAEFATAVPSLPQRVTVMMKPTGETVELPV